MPSGDWQSRTIKTIRTDRESAIISFKEITTRNDALTLRNAVIESEISTLPKLKKNEYLYEQIIGISVFTDTGEALGTVTAIMETGGNDVYIVQDQFKEYLIPAVAEFISRIDVNSRTMIIIPIDGLLDQHGKEHNLR